MKIYLLRHAHIETSGKMIGQKDIPLSEFGLCQAHHLKKFLSSIPFDFVFTSPLKRCTESVNIISAERKNFPKPIEIFNLREISLGLWEGLDKEYIKKNYHKEWKMRGENIQDFSPPQNEDGKLFGESFKELEARVLPAFHEICKRTKGSENILIMAHQAVNRVILSYIMKKSLKNILEIEQEYACINVLNYDKSIHVKQYLPCPLKDETDFLKASKAIMRDKIIKKYNDLATLEAFGYVADKACLLHNTASCKSDLTLEMGYSKKDLKSLKISEYRGLGCGNPIANADLKSGEYVLDLGCGSGNDCFLAEKEVGDHGKVFGLDISIKMIDLAKQNAHRLSCKNVEFLQGEMEALPFENLFFNAIISNCVINLSLEKEKTFAEAFRVLKTGGRLAISDILRSNSLPDSIRFSDDFRSSCFGGALSVDEMHKHLKNAGFVDISITPKTKSQQIIEHYLKGQAINLNNQYYFASANIHAMKPNKT